jgi:hypothetical protein
MQGQNQQQGMQGQNQAQALSQMQQQNQIQQQAVMQTPPQVITAKDLSYLKDEMSWELIAMKKCAHYAQECTDPEVRASIENIGKMHERHYNLLLQQCQPTPANTSAQGATAQMQ